MKFTVNFKAKQGYAVSLAFRTGCKLVLEAISNMPGIKGDISEAISPIQTTRDDFSATIDFDTALRSGHFAQQTEALVTVPSGFLNKYASDVFTYEMGSGKVKHSYRIDTDAIIKDWESAEFPLEWQ